MAFAPKFSFGTPATSTPAAPAANAPFGGGFSFGQPAASTSAPPAFSLGAPAATAPAAGGFSFGNLGSSTAPASQPAPTFGFAAPAASTSQAAPSFAFGSTTSTAPAPNALGTSTGLFNPLGSSTAPNPLSSSSAPATSLSQTTKSTRFEDLPEAERKLLLEVEQFIHGRTAIADELRARTLGEEIKRSYDVLQDIGSGLASMQTSLTQITRTALNLRSRTDTDSADRSKAQRIVDAYTTGKQGGPGATAAVSSARSLANFPYEYFTRQIDTLIARLRTYHEALNQVQGQLRQQDANQARAILPSLKAQHALSISLAAKLSTLHQDMTELRETYKRLWQDKVGSVRDPFEDERSRDAHTGMTGLSL